MIGLMIVRLLPLAGTILLVYPRASLHRPERSLNRPDGSRWLVVIAGYLVK